MKLEIKHLAPYLPYELKCYQSGEYVKGTENNEKPKPNLYTITGITTDCTGIIRVEAIDNEYFLQPHIEDVFPILRPLSDLNKEITINGELHQMWLLLPTLCKHSHETKLINNNGYKFEIQKLPYDCICKLFEYHIDVFGLIPNGLAIDINKLSN